MVCLGFSGVNFKKNGVDFQDYFQILYTHTIDFNLGQQHTGTLQPVAPGTDVNIVTGNISLDLPLFSSAGAGLSTYFSLRYNSGDHRTLLGIAPGWMHNFDVYLTDSWLAAASPDDAITLHQGDGSSVVFRWKPAPLGFHVADDEFGNFSRIERITIGSATTYKLTTKHGIAYRFDITGKLVEIEDRNGNKMILEYTNGKLVKISDSMNRETLIEYSPGGKIETITDPGKQMYALSYLDNGLLEKVHFKGAPAGEEIVWRFGYHQNDSAVILAGVPDVYHKKGLLARVFTPRGNLENYAYDFFYLKDGRCRVARQPEAAYLEENGSVTMDAMEFVFSYLDSLPGQDQSVLVRNRRDFNTRVVYERKRNLPLSITEPGPEEYTSNYFFGAYRNLEEFENARGGIGFYTYYHVSETEPAYIGDNLKTVNLPDGDDVANQFATEVAKYTYTLEGFNLVETEEDCNGSLTFYKYDAKGNLENIIYPLATLPDGTTQTSDQEFLYNNRGEITEAKDAKDNITLFQDFDIVTGLAETIRRPGTTTPMEYTFDEMGNITSITEEGGGKTEYERDGLYRIYQTTLPNTVTGQKIITTEYNADSQIDQESDNLDVLFKNTYDLLGRLVKSENALGKEMAYFYDPEDNLTGMEDYRDVMSRTFFDA
ncbi:MAG: DUF6531 domain-containing protein, partial [Thermoanaerobaculia bacterium]|nr:DUF6531 domain-containing protein [Thermoanaerobaculia bacterium]